MFEKMLIPLDGSEVSLGILPYVSYLAKRLDIPVVLALVVSPDDMEASGETTLTDRSALPIARSSVDALDEAKSWIHRSASQLSQQGIVTETVVATGDDPSEEILRLTNQQGCDFIAMATRDRNLLSQAFRGSVTNEVVRSARVPILAVAPEKSAVEMGQQITLSRVLVPLDGSAFSEAVLPYTKHLAQKLSLELLLLRILQLTDVYPPLAGAPMAADPGSARVQAIAEEAAEEEIVRYLEELTARLTRKGLNVSWQMIRGDTPARRVADLAQEHPDNMIALASHGRSGVARWILGSVAEDLIRATGDPVLVIPSELAEEGG
jgi:nucleotide-binding universal stress UspA family protein